MFQNGTMLQNDFKVLIYVSWQLFFLLKIIKYLF